ncbi:MAG TPA: hypothetical protein VFB08_02205 [Burkholderiales bacterium]|nr:hypothetical protein [Burkholderiales bacterium]
MDAPTDDAALDAAADEVLRQAATLSHEEGVAYLKSVGEDRPLVFAKLLERLPNEVAAVLGFRGPSATEH